MALSLRRRLLFGGAAALALAAGVGVALFDRAPPDAGELLALTLPDAGGRAQAISELNIKVLVVNFWDTWCLHCWE